MLYPIELHPLFDWGGIVRTDAEGVDRGSRMRAVGVGVGTDQGLMPHHQGPCIHHRSKIRLWNGLIWAHTIPTFVWDHIIVKCQLSDLIALRAVMVA
jgi:hypothetical protein